MITTIESISSVIDIDRDLRLSAVNEIIDQAVYFSTRSEITGRRISGNICAADVLREDRIVVVPGQFMSTSKNTVATNAAVAEATGLAVVGLELPGHGDSDNISDEERERTRIGDYQWLAEDYESILDSYGLITQLDSAKRYIYGISAGAIASSHLVEFGGGRYEKIAFLDPANLVRRGTIGNALKSLRENLLEANGAEDLLGRFNEGIESPSNHFSPRDLEVFLQTFRNFPWNGETGFSLIRLLEKYRDMKIPIDVCSNSRVTTKQDIKSFEGNIKSRSAELASRVSINTIQGINHNIGRFPLVVGELAARSFAQQTV